MKLGSQLWCHRERTNVAVGRVKQKSWEVYSGQWGHTKVDMTLVFSRNAVRLEQRGKRSNIRNRLWIQIIVYTIPILSLTSVYPIPGKWPLLQTAENTHIGEDGYYIIVQVCIASSGFLNINMIHLFGLNYQLITLQVFLSKSVKHAFSNSHSAYVVV